MSVLHSSLFSTGYPLIQRVWVPVGALLVMAPAGSAWVRASAGGAGGFKDDAAGWGGGGAFAFAAEPCLAGDSFHCQTGDTQFTRTSSNTVSGDTWVKRGDLSVLVYADRGRPNGTAGASANCTGAITRSGVAGGTTQGGSSAGDDADTYPLGFGGRGASSALAAFYGGGGGYEAGHDFPTFPAGSGRLCLEFYSSNPGY